MLNMTVIERISALLSEKSLKQVNLAAYIGVSNKTLNGWIKKNRDVPTDKIIPICRFFDISTEYLLTGEDYSEISTVDPLEQELRVLIHQLPRGGKEKVKIFITGLNEGMSVAADERQEAKRMAK